MTPAKTLVTAIKRFLFIQRKRIMGTLIVFFFLQNVVLAYNNLQQRTPIVGLRFENHSLFGERKKEVEDLIRGETQAHHRPLLLQTGDRVIRISQKDVLYTVKPENLTNELLVEGRQGTLLQKFIAQEKALLGLTDKRIHGTLSENLLTLKILTLQSEIDTNPRPPTLDFTHDMAILPAKDGEKIQVDKLSLLIRENIDNPPTHPLPIPLYTAFMNRHSTEELITIKKQAAELLSVPVRIRSGGVSFTLTPDDLKHMATVVERPNVTDAKKTTLSLRLDDVKLNQRLGAFAEQVENITHAEFDDHEARVAIYAEFYNPQSPRNLLVPTGSRINTRVLGATDAPGPKVAYLTFDDGPNVLYHPMILTILRVYGIKATFFLIGKNVSAAHDAAVETANYGHLIGNHSLTHTFLPNLQNAAILNELNQTDTILQSITTNQMIYFRPPYGGINQSVLADAHQLGLRVFLWDVDPRDWSEPSTDELVRRVVTATHNGSTILLHSNHLATVKALPAIIQTLQSEGYTFKTLADYPQKEQL